jgi:hypothetical protein
VLDGIEAAGLDGLKRARAQARERAWLVRAEAGRPVPTLTCAGTVVPGLVIDLDASLVTCHSEKDQAASTFKKGFGYHPVRREALSIRAEVRDHRRRPCRSKAV